MDAGLAGLSNKCRGDGSSSHSRELKRLPGVRVHKELHVMDP